MPGDTVLVARDFLSAISANDTARAFSYLASDATYCIHLNQQCVPFAGTAKGAKAISERWNAIAHEFEILKFEPTPATRSQEDWMSAQARIDFELCHLKTGLHYRCSYRICMRVVRGKIVVIDEYHDAPRFEAFMTFIAAHD